MSIPPVIITRLSAHERTMSEAFSFSRFRKVCGFLNYAPRKITARRYMAAKTEIVITRRRFVSESGFLFASAVSFCLFLFRKFI